MKPRIGIRPIIDGRQGGIREGLEEQTRKYSTARSAAARRLRNARNTFLRRT